MTGKEAWSIVAPILAAHTVHRAGEGLNALDEAYILTFAVLDRYDKMRQDLKQMPQTKEAEPHGEE